MKLFQLLIEPTPGTQTGPGEGHLSGGVVVLLLGLAAIVAWAIFGKRGKK